MLLNDMGKLYRVVMRISYWPQYAHRDLKEHLSTDLYTYKTLCGLTIVYGQWEAVIGKVTNLKKCKKCLKIKEKWNAEVH